MELLIGPIIGKVTATSARILIEIGESKNITMTLNGSQKETLQIEANKPTAFQFQGLSPTTKYTVKIEGCNHIPSAFKTTGGFAPTKFAVVSCNGHRFNEEEKTTPEQNLWMDLEKRVLTGKVDCVLHMGDQVYMDHNAWHGSLNNVWN